MSSDTGVHSAGERRMEAALAAADAAEGAAFFSLRFGAEHGVVPMAEQLLDALRARGATGMIVNMAAGGDIDTEVFQGIERCDTFLEEKAETLRRQQSAVDKQAAMLQAQVAEQAAARAL